MRLTYLILGIITMSLCSSCSRPDDSYEEPPIFEIKKDDMVSVENNTTLFNIDDTIIINSVVENTQTTTDGQVINLDEYYADEESKIVWYRLGLFKESNFGGLVSIPINDEYIESIEGESTTEGSASIRIVGTLKNEMFKNKFGIKLKEAGTYYLFTPREIIISGGDYTKGIIHIYTNIKNSDETGMYKFTVK